MSEPCPHCGRTMRQLRPDGRCAGCGKLLPPELRAPPPTFAGGSFQSHGLRFQVIDEYYAISGLTKERVENDLDKIFSRNERLPNLGKAPVASWVLARLARLTQGKLGSCLDPKQRNDGGGYAVSFLVYNSDQLPIAELELQGDSMGAFVLGRCSECISSEETVNALVSALIADAQDLTPCRISVIDPEWREDPEGYTPKPKRGARNWYGWDGLRFLGADNLRNARNESR